MICKGCPHTYENGEPFLSIGVQVKNKKSIEEGLNSFIQGDMLEGDNAYYCEKCDKKVDTLKRTCIKKLPRHLIISLKRFEFDFDKMVRVKVNDYCQFPMVLNMEPYTQEGLARRERNEKKKAEGEDEELDETLKYPKDYYEFKLTGIVVHTGTADSGHYYSFIKDRHTPEGQQEKWYEFNDHIVREFDPADIPAECFGGEDQSFSSTSIMNMRTMKWRNAYLLFYERVMQDDVEEDEEPREVKDVEMVNTTGGTTAPSQQAYEKMDSSVIKIQKDIEEKILYENQKYWQNRFLFGSEYHEFVSELCLQWNTSDYIFRGYLSKNNDFQLLNQTMPQEYMSIPGGHPAFDENLNIMQTHGKEKVQMIERQVFQFGAAFYITILQRSKAKLNIALMVDTLKAYINKDVENARWLIF